MRPALRSIVVLAIVFALAGCHRESPPSRAAHLVRLHREGEAVALLRGHLRDHPEDVPSRRMLVRVLASSGDLSAAKDEAAALARQLPGDAIPWVELGHAYELAHRYEEALQAYDDAATAAPASPVGPREGGMRAARWGETELAVPRLEEAVRRGATDAETYHVLGLARLKARDFDGATDAYERGLAADPGGLENLLGLATVAIVREDPAAALAAYDRLLARKPTYAPAHLGRAWALAQLGRRTEAARALDRAEELGAPKNNVARQRAALARPL